MQRIEVRKNTESKGRSKLSCEFYLFPLFYEVVMNYVWVHLAGASVRNI